jgi:hypothetical protein
MTNGIILQGIKTHIFNRLSAYDKKWVEELPIVLWSMRTIANRPRVKQHFSLCTNLELLEDKCDIAAFRVEIYQQALQKYHSQRVHGRALSIEDLVLKRDQRTKDKTKLTPPWQGPYIMVEIARPRAYRLVEIDGDILPNT